MRNVTGVQSAIRKEDVNNHKMDHKACDCFDSEDYLNEVSYGADVTSDSVASGATLRVTGHVTRIVSRVANAMWEACHF